MENNLLPHGWVETKLGEIADWGSGGTPQSTEPKYYNGDIPWLIIGDLNDGEITTSQKRITKLGLDNCSSKIVPVNSILCAMYGSIGKLGIAKIPCATNQAIAFTHKIHGDIPYMFLFYYLFSLKKYLLEIGKGGTQQNISQTVLKDVLFPLPPLPEQERIVVKLEALLKKVESNQQRTEKIPKLLSRFRQSVLAAAVSGKLTEDWRKENKKIENATDLLERIKQERIEKYGKECKKAKKENRRKPTKRFLDIIPNLDYGFFTDIPETWTITNIDFLAWVTKLAGFEYTKYIKFSATGEVPVIRAQNVQMGEFIDENIIYIDKKTSDFLERSQLFGREILMVFIGAGTGNVCMCPSDKRWHLAPNVAKIDVDGILNHYLNYYLQSPIGLQNTLSFMKATAQPSLSMETIRQIAVPLPPLEEQKEIVKRVEQLFAFADKIETRFIKAKAMLDKLPQSILAKAFRGELVPQDVNDEPASVLLEKIKAEKEKRKGKARK
jgi:type I restriction enzyme S subunit